MSGSFAGYVTEHLAVVAAGGYGWGGLRTTEIVAGLGLGIDASFHAVEFGGGLRVAGGPGRRTRPFVQALFGHSTGTVKVSAVGLNESTSVSGWSITPSGGVDTYVAPRVAIRVSASVALGLGEWSGENSFGVGAGLVFAFGDR